MDKTGQSLRPLLTLLIPGMVLLLLAAAWIASAVADVGNGSLLILGIVGWTHRWFRPHESDVSADVIGKTYADMILGGLVDTR